MPVRLRKLIGTITIIILVVVVLVVLFLVGKLRPGRR